MKKEKIIQEYKEKLEEILDKQFPKHQCKERGQALVLFSYAVIFLEKAIKILKNEKQNE